ncbi:type II toxin-antitoxin system VapB family antitoxin [Streptomyces sp. NPDC088733]|uniref:type II toxin-antitoxin system VapB family antitoxin n=1 Tax=Streptomyces sp. NPDC088733 TaxID=3365880 RepID=UPI003811ADA6
MRWAQSRTVIDLDGDALEAAAKVLGTSTKRDTVNTALHETVARNRRLNALRDLRDFADEGALDVDLLLVKRTRRAGYRPVSPRSGSSGRGPG